MPFSILSRMAGSLKTRKKKGSCWIRARALGLDGRVSGALSIPPEPDTLNGHTNTCIAQPDANLTSVPYTSSSWETESNCRDVVIKHSVVADVSDRIAEH